MFLGYKFLNRRSWNRLLTQSTYLNVTVVDPVNCQSNWINLFIGIFFIYQIRSKFFFVHDTYFLRNIELYVSYSIFIFIAYLYFAPLTTFLIRILNIHVNILLYYLINIFEDNFRYNVSNFYYYYLSYYYCCD